MATALWFARHHPTEAQMEDLRQQNMELVGVVRGMFLGTASLLTTETVWDTIEELRELCCEHNPSAIVGVFPAPVIEALNSDSISCIVRNGIPCLQSWNVRRAPTDGGALTFEHKRYCTVAHFPYITED